MSQLPPPYSMYRRRRRELDDVEPQEYKVTARFRVLTDRGVSHVIRLHAFPSGRVEHYDIRAFNRRFRPLEAA